MSNKINIFFKNLRNGDYSVRPFSANKTWKFSSDNIDMRVAPSGDELVWGNINTSWINMIKRWMLNLGTQNISISEKLNSVDDIHINAYRFFYPENHKYFGNVINISSSLYSNDYPHQPIDPKILWYYLDHNFYKDYFPDKFASMAVDDDQSNILAETGSILVLPRNLYGEGIKPGTFDMTMVNPETSMQYRIIDDGNGNIIDTSFQDSDIIDHRAQLLSIGFNEKYREYGFVNKKKPYVIDTSNRLNSVKVNNIRKINYKPGIPTTDTNVPTGVCAEFDETYLEVTNADVFNFSNELDFSFSFWVNLPEEEEVILETWDDIGLDWFGLLTKWSSNVDISTINLMSHRPLFNKNTNYLQDEFSSNTGIVSNKKSSTTTQFPFDISVTGNYESNPYKIIFSQSSGVDRIDLFSSSLIPNTWNHVVCQKVGNEYQIWINGVLDVSQSFTIKDNIQNNRHFLIGGDGNNKHFKGSLDEVNIFSKALTSSEISILSDNSYSHGSAYQSAKIGSIFYDRGIIIISDFRPKYANALLGKRGILDYENNDYGFNAQFKTSTRFYEHEIVCRIPRTEFNMTQNASTVIKYDKKQKPKEYLANKSFRPYFTTIGLYDDFGNLLAVAKLATPIKKRKDIDMNIIIRLDM